MLVAVWRQTSVRARPSLQLLLDDRVAVELVDDALDRQVLVAANDGKTPVVRPKAVVLGQRQLDVAVGYMVSRGLAKSGSQEPYWADRDDLPGRGD
jgi:hypothetical protein